MGILLKKQSRKFLKTTHTQNGQDSSEIPEEGEESEEGERPERAEKKLVRVLFLHERPIPKVVKSNPDLKVTEVGKKLGELWRAMSDSEKAPYVKKADADKIRYEKAKAAYNK